MSIRVSIVVVEFRTASYLEACLRALYASSLPREAYEVIVVDNASPTPVGDLRERFRAARWIHLRRNLGFAGASTVALGRARGDVIAGVNPDCTVDPGWLAAILRAFDADPRVGVVGSKILYPGSDVLQHAGGVLFGNARSEHLGHGERDVGQHDAVRDVDYVCGAAFAVRRATVDEVGYLSPAYYPAYYEETELCARARRAGWRVVYVPEARAHHAEAAASDGASSDAYLARYHEGRMRYALRNMGWRELARRFVPAELAFLSRIGRHERAIVGRSLVRVLRTAWGRGEGFARPGDLLAEHAPLGAGSRRAARGMERPA
ncbi:MAG: glycosyltransferase family 2 protein [Sandaracinaceae bacterium]